MYGPYISPFILYRLGDRRVNTLPERGVVLKETDMEQETLRLAAVLAEVRAQRAEAQRAYDGVREDMVQARKDFWEEFRFKPDDIWETLGAVLQQNKMLSEGERRYRHAALDLRNLDRLERTPYFGRVDFRERGAEAPEQIYIGVATLRTAQDDFLVYDWRTPVASLYYDHGPGPASYLSPAGDVPGEMLLKRQFVISEGRIRLMFDTGVTIGDELLMEALSGHADAEMHSIVATIQREQNLVIRDDRHRLLVVLGVAGSGKTSAALQRVAYLLYRHRETLQAHQMVLFSPNALFNSYVSAVLPELGEEPIHQTTYQAYLDRRLGQTMAVEDAYDQLEGLLAAREPEERAARLEGIRFKASLAFKEVLDRYATRLRSDGMVFAPLRFRGREIVSARDLAQRFAAFGPDVPASTRSNLLRDHLVEKLRRFERQAAQEDWVLDDMQLLGPEEFQDADLHRGGRKGAAMDPLDAVQAHLGGKIAHRSLQAARSWVDQRQFVDLPALYLRIFQDPAFVAALAPDADLPAHWPVICRDTAARLGAGVLSFEDATPFLYLDEQVRGFQVNRSVRHVFIDEAQDYAPFQLEIVRHLFPGASLTLLGDPSQAVSPAPSALARPASLAAQYAPGAAEIVHLRHSYRSTREIALFTRSLLPDGGQEIVPFDRRGEKPLLVQLPRREDLPARIADDVAALQRRGQQTIAVICRTAQEAERVHRDLAATLAARLIEKGATELGRGVSVLPGYLAKGLEFDAVILYDASAQSYASADELGLFYTACTRAMHHLQLCAAGALSPILAAADPATFTVAP